MPKIAGAKLTSEERCRQAFQEAFQLTDEDAKELDVYGEEYIWGDLWVGWRAAWRYLEKQVVKEFIQS